MPKRILLRYRCARDTCGRIFDAAPSCELACPACGGPYLIWGDCSPDRAAEIRSAAEMLDQEILTKGVAVELR